MVFFPEPLKPSEGREEDKLKIDPIEADRKYKESQASWDTEKEEKKISSFASFLVVLKKFTGLFSRFQREDFEHLAQDALTQDIQSLKSFLNQLKEGDCSNDAHYCQQLSELWHRLLEHIQEVSHPKQKNYVNMSKLKGLLTDMEHFPPNEDHKFGYYLVEYAGEEWLPVPFREILKYLHSDYKVNQEVSILTKWTDLIQEIIET